MRITVATPSVRPELLAIVEKCLSRQTFPQEDYEWLVCSPRNYRFGDWVHEPPKREGDYYSLNKAMNAMYKVAKGELIVEITDGIWFEPDTLEKLWTHYEVNPKACIGAVGNQYDEVINGKPEHLVWTDPRIRTDYGSFWEINPNDLELCIGSIPRKGIREVGGLDEKYDRGAALSEKEMALRLDKAGYKFFLDSSIEYRAIKHSRLNSEWDNKYKVACEMFAQDVHDILHGFRLNVGYLDRKE